ncbi:MAG: T9SS type A sorting domain-containing protein [Bacteroidia bacterium]|nr:T9SS type A sorting domain-containing protein [Bacteroidia bacterium]
MKKLFAAVCSVLSLSTYAQVVYTDIPYPTQNDSITVYFNASQGNAGLQGQSQIYMHTGLITDASAYTGDWLLKPFVWGTADANALMTPIGNNVFKKSFRLDSLYGFNQYTQVKAMMFVFRNANGTLTGKNADGSDIIVPVFPSNTGFDPQFIQPLLPSGIYAQNATVNVEVRAQTVMSQCNIFLDGQFIHQGNGNIVSYSFNANTVGKHYLVFEAQSGAQTKRDTTYFIVQPDVTVQDPPSGIVPGINYVNSTTVTICLEAPNKEFAYVIGDFTNWETDPQYFCKRSNFGDWYWTTISGLTPGQEYRFQFFVDGKIKVADPYSDKVIDEYGDAGINTFIYPNLISYPTGKTHAKVSVLQTNQTPYNWQHDNDYTLPVSSKLVIYETLIRDFAMRKAYTTIRDTLDYFVKLGVNAIQLMPVMEFDGNSSWGYSPEFFFAPDKKYGPREALKELVDLAHSKGIAVILDIVPNHAFGQNSYVRLYWDSDNNKPAANSPFFNPVATHPYSVGYDFNHESQYTRRFFKRLFRYWKEEYHIDGFRLDLSKGLTQTNSGGDIGAWTAYDQSRVNILFDYYNDIRSYSNDYVILEHLGDNGEETVLANGGFMLWSKATEQYNQCTMGYSNNNDFSWQTSFLAKGWNYPNAVSYMESHDEERIMYKNINFGNINGNYDTRSLTTSLKRMEAAAACFFTIPGPKMLWQFGELGYDFSINWPSGTEASRTSPKPVRWDYYFDVDRHRLFKVFAALIKLKVNNSAFDSWNYSMDTWGTGKRIWVNDPSMNVCVGANFDINAFDMVPGFQHTGTWYDYISGQAINVTDQNAAINFQPGDYHVWTDVQLPPPDLSGPPTEDTTSTEDVLDLNSTMRIRVYPNPSAGEVHFEYTVQNHEQVKISIFDIAGKEIAIAQDGYLTPDRYITNWNGRLTGGMKAPAGVYFFTITHGNSVERGKLILE